MTAEPRNGRRAWRGVRVRVTLVAVVATIVVLVAVGAAVVAAQRELLLDDLAAAEPGAREAVAEAGREWAGLLIACLPIVVLAVGVLVWWLVGRTLRPVEAIRTEVEAISGRDLHRRVPLPGTGDEIDRLALTMNDMLARLQAARDAQDRFVADASHELRSPLARMIADLEVDTAHPRTADAVATRAAQLSEARRLADLVDVLLDTARADAAGAEDIPPDLIDLDDVVLAEITALAPGPGVRLDATGVSAAQVRGRTRTLAVMVRNLLANAQRHAVSRVTVTLASDGKGEVVLAIEDDGPGVPTAAREMVFDRFTRLDEARTSHGGGAGLGLSIARDVATRAGGTIAFEDPTHSRTGARVVVRFARR